MASKLSLAAIALAGALSACTTAQGNGAITVPVNLVSPSGIGASVGELLVRDGASGVRLEMHLHGLPPGDHGMHLHASASCAAAANAAGEMTAAGAAGSHFDPQQTGHHEGPNGAGHLGDLPFLHVDASGAANQTLVAPRFHAAAELRGHAIVIHASGDNYSDTPAPLGGGGGRIACGVVN
jgi:Cu-Zn family superoxide dismutase